MIILSMGLVPGFLTAAARGHIGFAADYRFDAVILRFLIEINDTEEVAVVRHRHGWHAVFFYLLKEWSELVRPIKEAILGVEVEVYEF